MFKSLKKKEKSKFIIIILVAKEKKRIQNKISIDCIDYYKCKYSSDIDGRMSGEENIGQLARALIHATVLDNGTQTVRARFDRLHSNRLAVRRLLQIAHSVDNTPVVVLMRVAATAADIKTFHKYLIEELLE